ncbi:MAG: NfeD family protein [Candidatus Rokuibacteriota bacterium]
MWCHLLVLLPVAGLGLFFVLPWPAALALNALLTALAVGIAVPAVQALRRPALTGMEALVGQVAEAATVIEREGLVRYGGELWTATANGHRISKGGRVSIVGVQGTKLTVRAVQTEPMTQRIRQSDE